MYLQWLVKKLLEVEDPIYEYSGVMLSYKKRFEGMVTENQAVTVFRNQIRQFFNEAVSPTKVSKIDALLTTGDPVMMKTIICYGTASKIDTLTDTLCPLSSPDQWLSQSNQKELTA